MGIDYGLYNQLTKGLVIRYAGARCSSPYVHAYSLPACSHFVTWLVPVSSDAE